MIGLDQQQEAQLLSGGYPQKPRRNAPSFTEVQAELLRREFARFTKEGWSIIESRPFTSGWHIDAICEHLTYVALGEISQLMINIPPRHSKSTTASVMWPCWVWTDQPELQFLFASYDKALSHRDAIKSRRLLMSKWYQERWGDRFVLSWDENQKGYYSNDKSGYRISTSEEGGGTGHGGDITVNDDPHNMDDIYSKVIREGTLDWYDNVWRSRQNDPNNPRRVIIAQRGHVKDLCGHLLSKEADEWVHLNLPAEYNPKARCVTPYFKDPRKKKGEVLCPNRMNASALKKQKKGMAEKDYEAQFNQRPEGAEGYILKKKHWKRWPGKRPPTCIEVIQVYDTAFEEKEEADESARTTWGIFAYSPTGDPGDEQLCCILLERWHDRVGFPELRRIAKEGNKDYAPDFVLVEKKASGHSLIQELRRVPRLPVRGVKIPTRSKAARAHVASVVLEKGAVWYMDREWAYDVIDQCAAFTGEDGGQDDMVDTCVIAWMFLRKRRMIGLGDDDEIDDEVVDEDDMDLFSDPVMQRSAGYG